MCSFHDDLFTLHFIVETDFLLVLTFSVEFVVVASTKPALK